MEVQNINNQASYYLMKNGFILRLEEPLQQDEIPLLIKANLLEPTNLFKMNQDQANYRVAIFRDEILELDEYKERVFGISA
ncbi:MAG: hypothetical protein CME62_04960 [Halobacteriovoraceae bacterium]|nr:hypothetical protein [Halobacteriovoraceae bacterium]|tara:strand:- start:4734 stop:4976 length:243 start_codon:yes stop_codon:yes gene_type:complete